MKWYAINKEYVNYLKQFDAIVPNVDYTGKLKNFLGVVFKSEYGWDYFAPLTSYKPKFRTMQNTIDFYKIVNENGKIYGAIDLNNMIPVPKGEYIEVTPMTLPSLRTFDKPREITKYWRLLKIESSLINDGIITYYAEKLYQFVLRNPSSSIAERCCNFSLLEKKCAEYVRNKGNSEPNRVYNSIEDDFDDYDK